MSLGVNNVQTQLVPKIPGLNHARGDFTNLYMSPVSTLFHTVE